MRFAILTLALLFALVIGAFTGLDLVHYGVTIPGLFGAFIFLLFLIAIVGAITERRPKE